MWRKKLQRGKKEGGGGGGGGGAEGGGGLETCCECESGAVRIVSVCEGLCCKISKLCGLRQRQAAIIRGVIVIHCLLSRPYCLSVCLSVAPPLCVCQ